MKFRKKRVVVDAVQWTGSNMNEIMASHDLHMETLVIKTLEGEMTATKGDWIIKGLAGEFYPVKDDIFRKTYEEVEE